MGKRVVLVLALLATLVLGSCSVIDFGWWQHNIEGNYQVIRRSLHSMHRTWDYHFMNYDWDDPYIN